MLDVSRWQSAKNVLAAPHAPPQGVSRNETKQPFRKVVFRDERQSCVCKHWAKVLRTATFAVSEKV